MKKKKINIGKLIVFILAVIVVSFFCFLLITKLFKGVVSMVSKDKMYVASSNINVPLYNMEYKEDGNIARGMEIVIASDKITNNEKDYYKISYNKKDYYISTSDLSKKKEDVVKEKEMFVRTPATVYKNNSDLTIAGLAKKSEKVEILGYDKILADGSINMYKVKYADQVGYVYGKYMANTIEKAKANYDEDGTYKTHLARKDTLMGGSGGNLDYYPNEKPKFENNVMPSDTRTLYVNAGVIKNIDAYIALAKESGINAIIVDIKDNTAPAYPAKAMEKYSPTNYAKAFNSYDNYKAAIKKIKDAGLYAIGRITVFKDSYYVKDHPEDTIKDTATGQPFNHDGSFWPSAFRRNVWEFNVALAVESVTEMGFNEIQFDYVRFPDRIGSLEKAGKIDFGNTYNEEKAQAIQRFLMYATNEIHKYNAYVSADVFGESAHNYVTAYGQYWPAISNVVDVISGMPYPDHFSKYEYGFKDPVWTTPYKLLKLWGETFVMKRQAEIPTPAVVRTWIQAYDTGKSPATVYDSYMVSEQLKGLYEAGLTGGFMTWNGSSSLDKYKSISPAFGKDY